MRGIRSILMLSLTLLMLLIAVPRLTIELGWSLPTIFSVAWLLLALLIIASHLHTILKVDEETNAQLESIKKYRRWKTEQYITKKVQKKMTE